MADGKQLSAKELTELANQFNAIADPVEKARFYHATPALHALFRAVHFPNPEDSAGSSAGAQVTA